jgi:hypothetical protein
MYSEIRTLIEVISALMCFILVRFMIKPYEITGESRYIGLPVGFGFLGTTYIISALAFYVPRIFGENTIYIQLIARTFSFFFISSTYFFSTKSTRDSKRLWTFTLIILITSVIISFLILSLPVITLPNYIATRNFLRVLNLIFILYICSHTFRSHIQKPDPTTIWIPLGYAFLAVSQYSILIFQLDGGLYAFFAGLILRLVFLSVFLIVSFRAFFHTRKGA